ncbi:MAG: cytochrome bc complex cytochrome b subunit [Ignavibacteria bacterium RBG_16_36_9]|nr:MAG: cytochrome bc complex cytochrome b subunit [Ignavibacteria bacterium RBG_16_36_9]
MLKNTFSKIESWLDERYDLSPFRKLLYHKKVPTHKHSIWYYMGGITLFLFCVQVLTGIMLLIYYKPGEESAYESVRFIVTEVRFGWLIRNVHTWSANLMIFFAFVHMFSAFFTKAFKKPRELTWVTGFILLILAMAFGFSGYLLPWNELAFFATKVGTDIVGVLPFIGEDLREILRGSEDVTGATLTRFFGIHVAVLPLIFNLFLIIHLLFVQRQGMHEPEHFQKLSEEKKKFIPFFPNFALRDALLWIIVFNILIFLALFFPWDLGLKADPFTPAPEGIKPEWYFMFMFQTLKYIPSHVLYIEGEVLGIFIFLVAGLIWMLVPFIKFKERPNAKIQPLTLIGILIVAFIVFMTILVYLGL